MEDAHTCIAHADRALCFGRTKIVRGSISDNVQIVSSGKPAPCMSHSRSLMYTVW